jgi:hypothetical protein
VISDTNSARQRASSARLRVEHELSFAARNAKVEAIYDRLAASRTSPERPT